MTMKRIILATVSVLVFITALFSLSAVAEDNNAVFGLSDFNALPGQAFETTLFLEENSNLVDFQLQLHYDTELVTLQSAEQDDELLGTATITDKGNGIIHISYTRTSENLTAKTNLVKLTFEADEHIGVGSYDFLYVDESYDNEAHSMNGLDFSALNMSYDFDKLVVHAFGDVNLDGKVSILDVTMLRQHLAFLRTLSDYQLVFADARNDGVITISDAVRMQQFLADNNVLLGDRINVTFYNMDGSVYTVRSVKYGQDMNNLPAVPYLSGYSNGKWSAASETYTEVSLKNVTQAVSVYAVYTEDASAAVSYYKKQLTNMYYSESALNNSLSLTNSMPYQGTYNALIYWSSSNNATLNATTGAFNQPAYDSSVTLTASIVSYHDGYIEAEDSLAFAYSVKGLFATPTKAEIETYLHSVIGSEIDYDMKLPRKITNIEVNSPSPYEVRLSWAEINGSEEKGISQISRGTSSRTENLVATVTFNGQPLEGNGKIYFDDVTLAPITEDEIRYYIINQIAANMGLTMTSNEDLWNDDTVYGSTVKWISGNTDIAVIANNHITVSDYAVNGISLPLTAEVTYPTDDGTETFILSYTVSIANSNALLEPGTNIDPDLYDALKANLGVHGSLTTDSLKSTEFVFLDLSGYPGIKDLTGLSYCRNIRVLNISGLRIERGINQIATLSKLEALIARDCGLDNLTDGGVPVLKNMIQLKLLDLSYNNFTSLDSVLSSDVRYGKLSEVYLNNNKLEDISGLNLAPILGVLVLSDNGLESDDIQSVANFEYLTYLSLANNRITDISALRNLTALKELRLQNNQISNVRDLRFMRGLTALYLGGNGLKNNFTGSGSETNLSYLKYLESLRVLYLNNNEIEDLSDLSTLENLVSINVSNNKLQSLSFLENMKPDVTKPFDDAGDKQYIEGGSTKTYPGIVEIFAEHNEIETFSFVRGLTGLKKLLLADNAGTYEANLPNYLAGLTQLESLTLSGKKLVTLSFLSGMTKLVRLEVAGCSLPSYVINSASVATNDTTGEQYLQVNSFDDNVQYLLGLKSTLKFLDICDNGFAFYADDMIRFIAENNGQDYSNVAGIIFAENQPSSFNSLYELSGLIALYADNITEGIDASTFMTLMTNLRYLSLENCGIVETSWINKYRNLVYVDLAGNNITSFDFGDINQRCKSTLEYLYLDTNVECTFADAYMTYDDNVLKALSLKNMGIPHIDYLPPMDDLQYLNLSGTAIGNLMGSNEEFYEVYAITRFEHVKTIDVSHMHADITPLLSMDSLDTVYAIGDDEDYVFYKCNIDALYSMYNKGLNVYLYDYDTPYEPLAPVEGEVILGQIEDISCDLTVAANNQFSDNNPHIVDTINDFDITWTVSNSTNYEIKDNHLSVKDYAYLDDEALTLTAQISVYPNQAPVTRTFTINTHVLRADENYVSVNSTGMEDYLVRSTPFTYDVTVQAAPTGGFAEDATPVYDEVRYTYTATKANGEDMVWEYALDVGDNHAFAINEEAPLGGTVTIKAEIGHFTDADTFVVDQTRSRTTTIATRTFTLTYVPNGGTVTNQDGNAIISEQYQEDAELFANVTIARLGYVFEGWFMDEGLTEAFTATTMPMHDVTLYAKWEANSFHLLFNANSGTVSVDSKLIVCDTAFGELPTATKQYYIFDGWFTEEVGGEQVTDESVMTRSEDLTVYAHWTPDTYVLTFNANGGTVSESSRTVFCNQELGSLPRPTRDYYNFLGWYTATSGGAKVTETTSYNTATTIYAQWELKPISGWTLDTNVPAGAQIVNTKYTFTHRYYTTSSSSSMSGWTKYDTQRTSWGNEQGPVYSNPSNGERSVRSEQYVSGYNTKHIWRFYKWGYSSTDYSYSYDPGGGRSYLVVDVDYWPSSSGQRPVDKDGSTFRWWTGNYWSAVWYESERDDPNYDSPIYGTRWYYKEPVYTYYYYKDVDEELESCPSGSEYSNIQTWVQYRAK